MDEPAIAEDNYWGVHVMWLDGADMDRQVEDPAGRRYIANKRSLDVHPKGWERIWAATVDVKVTMVADGAYMKIPTSQKNIIVSRVQSWILRDQAQGVLHRDIALPLVGKKKPRLRVGQTKAKVPPKKPKPTPAAAQKKPLKPVAAKKKPPKAHSSSASEGPTITLTQFDTVSLCQNHGPRRIPTPKMNLFNKRNATPKSNCVFIAFGCTCTKTSY